MTVRKAELEGCFLELLRSLQPRPGYFALFKEIVLDGWKAEAAQATKAAVLIEKRVSELRERLQHVEDRYLADDIDRRSYQELRDRLRYDLAWAELDRNEARIEETDVEGVLAFAHHVMENATALWTNASADDRRALQGALFPTGLAWDGALKSLPPPDGHRYGRAVVIGARRPGRRSWRSSSMTSHFSETLHPMRQRTRRRRVTGGEMPYSVG